MSNITEDQEIEGLVDTKSIRTQASVQNTAATSTSLTIDSEYKWIYTGTIEGQNINLPSALTLKTGHMFEIHNNATQTIILNNASSVLLFSIKSGYRLKATLQDNTTIGGIWSIDITADVEAITQITQIGTTSSFNDFLFDGFHAHSLILSTVLNGGTGVINDGTYDDNTSSGLVIVGTGTTNNSTGKSIAYSSANMNIFAGGQTVEWRIRLLNLSTATIRYNFKAGTQNNAVVGDPTSGIYFQYTDNVNSGRWVGITRNASTSTPVNSTVTVVANTWYRLRYVANPTGTSVDFYVNDVFIGSSSLNIPVTNGTRFQASIEKQTPNTTTTRLALLDWYQYSVLRVD